MFVGMCGHPLLESHPLPLAQRDAVRFCGTTGHPTTTPWPGSRPLLFSLRRLSRINVCQESPNGPKAAAYKRMDTVPLLTAPTARLAALVKYRNDPRVSALPSLSPRRKCLHFTLAYTALTNRNF
uniref:Uncharacterized protein n=1 Tax=Plectus sambesii TaxID=2011161 RepID=A0A914W4B3_9BILA